MVFFVRQGANSKKLIRDEIIQFNVDENKICFDNQINTKFEYVRDFDVDKLEKYLKVANVSIKQDAEDALLNLEVAEKKNGRLFFRNAGILFFAKEPCKFFSSAYVDAVVFKGIERVDVIDRKIFSGSLLENLESVYTYLREHLNLRYEHSNLGLKRSNIYELPLNALREVVVNALMHRDYFITGANVSVCIFEDRVEVTSPGSLPKPLTISDLGKKSKRRNEIIANLFARLDFVEKLGTGISKVRQWMKEYQLEEPHIEVGGFFYMYF